MQEILQEIILISNDRPYQAYGNPELAETVQSSFTIGRPSQTPSF